MDSFKDREKNFEKKFAHDEEKLFKINARRNKYLAEWAFGKLNKNDLEKDIYIQEVIKSDFAEPGDEDVFRKIQKDLKESGIEILDQEIRDQMASCLERAKKDFL